MFASGMKEAETTDTYANPTTFNQFVQFLHMENLEPP